MNIELCLTRDNNPDKILASKVYHKIDTVALHSSQISSFPDASKKKSVLVDYPYGLGNTTVREHEIIYSARCGVSYIDVALNSQLVSPARMGALCKELQIFLSICRERKIELRPIIEYRNIHTLDVMELCSRLDQINVGTVIIGTGSIVDDMTDNLIMCQQIMIRTSLEAIPTLSFPTSDQTKQFAGIGVKIIRLMSITSVENLFK